LVTILILILGLLVFSPPKAEAAEPEIHVLSIDGPINPLTSQYLARGLREGADARAVAVVVRLNTPGGLESSTREMVQAMLGSSVPVVVYVTPSAARAASAGMFITIAANVAAMAPGTNIGSAHPVNIGEQTDPVMAEKVVNDSAALARAIANARGRNAVWAEQAVRESVSITAAEALDQRVIDLVAADVPDLLRQLDGRTVTTAQGPIEIRTAGVSVAERPMLFTERILQTIADPNIAYILFTIGVIGLIAELYNPGALFPGITGAISLVLAFVAFGSLPVSWAGILLILIALGLFVAELNTEGIGVLGAAGLVAFVLGSFMLYTPLTPPSPTMPAVGVSPVLVVTLSVAIAGSFLFVLRTLFEARKVPVVTGVEALVGLTGVAETDFAPNGIVRVGGESWSGVTEAGPVRKGEEVEVVGVEGITLRVLRR
jgi:membrane-bound serine protease (ClpP class)